MNVKGLFFSVQKGLPLLNDEGCVILTGSIADIDKASYVSGAELYVDGGVAQI